MAEFKNLVENVEQVDLKENCIIKCWQELNNKPKCIVFDLDYTLWPFIIDHQLLPPLRKVHNKIYDHLNRQIKPYEDVPVILKTLRDKCLIEKGEYICIASRATAKTQALQLFDLFSWNSYFDCIQIYAGSKLKHMNEIKNELNLKNFTQILFFDDSKSNLDQTESLGLVGYKLSRHYGLSIPELIKGLKKYDSIQNKK